MENLKKRFMDDYIFVSFPRQRQGAAGLCQGRSQTGAAPALAECPVPTLWWDKTGIRWENGAVTADTAAMTCRAPGPGLVPPSWSQRPRQSARSKAPHLLRPTAPVGPLCQGDQTPVPTAVIVPCCCHPHRPQPPPPQCPQHTLAALHPHRPPDGAAALQTWGGGATPGSPLLLGLWRERGRRPCRAEQPQRRLGWQRG